MAQAALGCGGATIPGGVQELWRCGTKEHGLEGHVGVRWTVGLDDLRGFSHLNDSVNTLVLKMSP